MSKAQRGSRVGHRREWGDDRKDRTDGESCVMSPLPSSCSGFIMQRSRRFDAFSGSASTREGEKVWVGVHSWRDIARCCQVSSTSGLITHETALREFLTCFIISCGTRRRTKIVHSSAHQINAKFCLYVFNIFVCVCLWLWKLDIISTTCKQLASIWKAGIKKGI